MLWTVSMWTHGSVKTTGNASVDAVFRSIRPVWTWPQCVVVLILLPCEHKSLSRKLGCFKFSVITITGHMTRALYLIWNVIFNTMNVIGDERPAGANTELWVKLCRRWTAAVYLQAPPTAWNHHICKRWRFLGRSHERTRAACYWWWINQNYYFSSADKNVIRL